MRALLLPVVLLLAGCDNVDKRQMDDMAERIDKLEAKIETLQKSQSSRPTTPTAPSAAPVDSPEEKAATALMQQVQQAQAAGKFDEAKAKLAELQEKYATTRAGKASVRMAQEINLIGSAAHPIEVEKWYQGKADYSNAKATVVVFWEAWCPHCKDEMPKMQPFAEKWKSKGVQVVAFTKVTKTSTDDLVESFIKTNNLQFPIGKEKDGSMSTAFAVTGIPAAAIVKDGKIAWRGHPARLTDDLVNSVLGS